MTYVKSAGLIYLAAIVVSAVLLYLFWRRRVRKKPGPELLFAGVLVNLLVSVPLVWYLPGTSYITVLPAIFLLVYAGVFCLTKNDALRYIFAGIAALCVPVLLVPVVTLVFQALTIGILGVGVLLGLLAVSALLPILLSQRALAGVPAEPDLDATMPVFK